MKNRDVPENGRKVKTSFLWCRSLLVGLLFVVPAGGLCAQVIDYASVKKLLMRTEGSGKELEDLGTKITPFLVEIYENEDERDTVRKKAVGALALIGDESSMDTLIHALEDSNWNTKFYAVEGLGKIGDVSAVDPISSLLEGGSWGPNNDLLIEALGALGDARALPVLERIVEEDPDARMRQAAEAAIVQIQK